MRVTIVASAGETERFMRFALAWLERYFQVAVTREESGAEARILQVELLEFKPSLRAKKSKRDVGRW